MDGSYTAPAGIYDVLVQNGNGTWTLTHKGGGRDSAGLITGESQAGVYAVAYTYDNAYQLTREQRTGTAPYDYTYTYDSVGNRLTKYDGTATENYSYDDADKLLTAGSKSYGYDNAGNLTSVTVGSNVTTLSWDYAGRLSGITYPNSSTNSFTYNDLGQRTSKTDSAGTSASLYDGSRVLADSRADYTNGGLTGLVSERASGTTLTYHGDQLGSTRGLTDGSQTVTASPQRDAWGNVVSSSGTLAGPFGFVGGQGYQQDADSGLMRLGARYYDASVGRFISRDPIRYGGGDTNLYRYCTNNPANATDPTGYFAFLVVLAAILVVAAVLVEDTGRPYGTPGIDGNLAFIGDFHLGVGDSDRFYPPGSPMSEELRNSPSGDDVRRELAGDSHSGRPLKGGVGTIDAAFNTFMEDPFNGTQMQVGGFNWRGEQVGDRVLITPENEASRQSWFYHLPVGNIERPPVGPGGPYSTIRQTFTWFEDVP